MDPERRPLFLLTLCLAGLILAGVTAAARAQDGQAQGAEAAPGAGAADQPGPGFTFQGQLRDNGAPVNGACDIQAGLWSAAGGGGQVGGTQTLAGVPVQDGRFTVVLNAGGEFGATPFTGQARWLALAVRCPAGAGSYTTLQPRQPLTAAPYAHGLLPGAVISGSVGTDTNAVLSLSNLDENGVGLRVFDTGLDGVFVDRAGRDGVYVGHAQQDGLFICTTGNEAGCSPVQTRNGIEIGRAQDNGIYIESAGAYVINGNGIYICNVGSFEPCTPDSYSDGIEIGAAYNRGLAVGQARTGLEVLHADTGLKIDATTYHGVEIDAAGGVGFYVTSAGGSGLYIDQANFGVAMRHAFTDGFAVTEADDDGLDIGIAGQNGVTVGTSVNAFWASSASADGLYVQSAGFNGVDVSGGNLAGYFGGAVQITGGCVGCLLANFGLNAGTVDLNPGDVVIVTGSRSSGVDSAPLLLELAPSDGEGAAVGVVMGRAEAVTVENPHPGELGRRLIPRAGAARPGDFVTIVTYGLAPVRVNGAQTPIAVGERLAAAAGGAARPLQTVQVDGVTLSESAPVLGLALEAGDADSDGLVWALVNLR